MGEAGTDPWGGVPDGAEDLLGEAKEAPPSASLPHRGPDTVIETVFRLNEGAQEDFPALFRAEGMERLHPTEGGPACLAGSMGNRPHPPDVVAKNALLARLLPD